VEWESDGIRKGEGGGGKGGIIRRREDDSVVG